jgi:lysophospholipase L1-like esterase
MSSRQSALSCLLVVFAFTLGVSRAQSAPKPAQPQWIGAWAASPMIADGGFRVRPFCGTTLREIVHLSAGGPSIRVRLTNEFGADQLTITDAHVALSAGGARIQPGSDHPITFAGSSTVRIPPGAVMYSDPVDLAVAPISDVAVSFYIPSQIMRSETFHDFANQDNFFVTGDVASATDLGQGTDSATVLGSWYFLDGIDVPDTEGARTIVAFGDSITDGAHSTRNANRRWPDFLAQRLQQDPKLKEVSVVDEGIGGNRVLNDQTGPNALARLDRDVLAQNGVRYLIVLESINDIGRLAHLSAPEDAVTAEQLEAGLRQIVDAAHEHGIKVIGATLTPYGGAGYYSEKGEQVREQVNDWIRSSNVFDGVADFDKATRDPQNPNRFAASADSGDHLHPGDEGYRAMAASIDLALFVK